MPQMPQMPQMAQLLHATTELAHVVVLQTDRLLPEVQLLITSVGEQTDIHMGFGEVHGYEGNSGPGQTRAVIRSAPQRPSWPAGETELCALFRGTHSGGGLAGDGSRWVAMGRGGSRWVAVGRGGSYTSDRNFIFWTE